MEHEINLISDRKKYVSSKAKQVLSFKIAAGICLAIIVLSGVLLFWLNKLSGIDTLLKIEQDDTSKIASKQKIIGKLLLVESRINDINSILGNRSAPDVFIQKIIGGMPSGVRIDSFSLTKKKASLTVTSSSLMLLDQFTTYLLNKAYNKEIFKTFTINSVIADPVNQRYILSFDTDLL